MWRTRPSRITASSERQCPRPPGALQKSCVAARREPDSTVASETRSCLFRMDCGTRRSGKLANAYELLSNLPPAPPPRSATWVILLQHGKHGLAVQLFAKAAMPNPQRALTRIVFGREERAGNLFAAIDNCGVHALTHRNSIRYLSSRQIYEGMGRNTKEQVIREYLRFMPQNSGCVPAID